VTDKVDFKKTLKELYSPPSGDFALVDVPPMRFLMSDGQGDPNSTPQYQRVVESLYPVAYKLKFASKNELGRDYVVPPLEGLWWSTDTSAFVRNDRDAWQWTMMIMVPEWVDDEMTRAVAERVDTEAVVRIDTLHEGPSLQILHIGSYADEAPTLQRLHETFMPANNWTFSGKHHEIYLSDPRKTEASKLKTVLRQPVKPCP
jgi:hypothetical protein